MDSYCIRTCNIDGWHCRKKKLFKSWIQLRRRSEGPLRDRQLHPSRDDNVPFFFKRLPRSSFLTRKPFPHNSNYPRRPARARARSFAVVSSTAQRALISGSLVGYPQKTFRKKFHRHFVEPPGQRTRMLFIFFSFILFSLSLSLSLSFSPRYCRRTGFLHSRWNEEGLKKGRYRRVDLFPPPSLPPVPSWSRFVNFLIRPR